MVSSIYYDVHPLGNIALGKYIDQFFSQLPHELYPLKYALDNAEREIIACSPEAIHVFWIDLLNIKQVEDWPLNRRKPSTTKKTSTGIFVTYQSVCASLASLGDRGDL